MSDVTEAGEEALPTQIPIEEISVGGEGRLSPREAAQALSQHRWKRDAQEAKETKEPEAPQAAEAQPDTAQAEPAAPETDTSETTEAEPQETAPLELPRSWSKDQSELWAKLPPETQAYLLEQDSKATRAVRQAQNEAAEQRKAAEEKAAAMEQARKQYDEALPVLLQTLQQQQLGEFADIKTPADVERLAREDWPRYALWDAKQKQLQAVQQDMAQSQQRQQQEFKSKWDQFAKDEDARFLEKAPEMSDEGRARKVADASLHLLKDIGFSDQDLSKLWNGEASLSLRDHRAQLLIRDAVRYREAQSAAKTKAVKPVPTVQRPGSPVSRTPDADSQLKNLSNQIDSKSGFAAVRAAAELVTARRSRQ